LNVDVAAMVERSLAAVRPPESLIFFTDAPQKISSALQTALKASNVAAWNTFVAEGNVHAGT
jgi:hypothetical protein